MRKASILLSALASFALSGNIVNNLNIEQINKINSNSNFSNDVNVSQGTTNITDNSNIEDVYILQKDGISAGNLIENTTVNGNSSELHQGLTSINSSSLYHTELTSKNKVNGITVTGGKSIITQGNLIIGGDSNVSGTAGSSGGNPWDPPGASGENLEIIQNNILEDTSISNSNLHQGLTVINNGATVSSSFKLEQNNNMSSNSINNDTNSTITQGLTSISGGDTSNIKQKILNTIQNITVDGVNIEQSSVKLINSTVSNINNNNDDTTDDDINEINGLTATDADIVQSTIRSNSSTIDGLQKSDRGDVSKNNAILNLTLNNSTAKQSIIDAQNGSDVKNVTYNAGDLSSYAINGIYASIVNGGSNLKQDVTELDNGEFQETTINRVNTISQADVSNSDLKQFNIKVINSTLENSNLNQNGLIWQVNATNALISQGNLIISD